jgi:LuxR family transcriptional regulator, maltose regulon positive regulatory protein
MGLVGCAEVLYEWNDLAGAMHAATQGIELLRGTVERRLLVRGYIVLAQAHQAHADHEAALERIRHCEEWFAQTQIAAPGTRAWLAAHQARLWVRQGNLEVGLRWVPDRPFTGDSEVASVQQLTLVRLRLAQSYDASGTPFLSEASALLKQLLPTFEAQGWARYLIEGLMLQALVCQAQADKTTALSTLQRALTLAEPEGYIRLFVDAGAPMAALLAQVAGRASPVAPYAARLLAAFPRTAGRGQRDEYIDSGDSVLSPQSSALIEPLSEREREVLRLIADGHSNQEIADILVVAVSTVKRHINNFYGKLGVQSRTQALVRARELKLL